MRRFTSDELAEIRRSYRNCCDPNIQVEILADLHVCDVQDIQRVLGLPVTKERRRTYRSTSSVRPRWTLADDQRLISLYMRGVTNREIADEMCRSSGAVNNRIRLLRTQKRLPMQRGAAP